jgi:hypothetical protein
VSKLSELKDRIRAALAAGELMYADLVFRSADSRTKSWNVARLESAEAVYVKGLQFSL